MGATNWLFSQSDSDTRWWRVIAWWELRRIPFNLIIGVYGIACLAVFLWAITTSGHLSPGEDAVDPMAIIAAPSVINILYTLGWVVELQLRVADPTLSPQFAPSLLKAGLIVGAICISVPALFWGGYRTVQLVTAVK